MDWIEDTDSIHSASTEILLNENYVNSEKKEEIIKTEIPRKMDKVHRDSAPDIMNIADESSSDCSSSDYYSDCSSDCSSTGKNYVITITTTSSKPFPDKKINNTKTTTSTITIKQRLNGRTSDGDDVINEINIGKKSSDSNNRGNKKSKKRQKKQRQNPSKKQKSHNVRTTSAQSKKKRCKVIGKMKERDSLDSSNSREINEIGCSNENSYLIDKLNVPKNEILLEKPEKKSNGKFDDLEETENFTTKSFIENQCNFHDEIIHNNISSVAEKTTKSKAELQQCKPKFERTLCEPELYTIDDDDLIYVNTKDSSKITTPIETKTEPIKMKLRKNVEFAVVDLTECNDDFVESKLFSDNCDSESRREDGFKFEKDGGKILDDSDIVVLSDSDDNSWCRRLSKAQLFRESRKNVNDLEERRENVEEFGRGENMLFRHENFEDSRESSFSSNLNNNEEIDVNNNNNNTGEIGEKRNRIVVEKQIAVEETVCKEIDENRNEHTSTSRAILQTEKSVYCKITEEKNETKRSANKNRSVEAKRFTDEKRGNAERRSYDVKKFRDATYDRDENRATDMRRTQDERRFHDEKSCGTHERSANGDSANEADGVKMSEHTQKSHKWDVEKQRDKIKLYRKEMLRKIPERKINAEADESSAISVPVADENVTGESSAKKATAQSPKLAKERREYFLFSKPLERTKKRSSNFKRTCLEKRNESEESKESCESTNAKDKINSQHSKNEDENSAIQVTTENVAEELRIGIDGIFEPIIKDIEVADVSNASGMPKTTRRVNFDDSLTKVHVFEIEPGNKFRKFYPKEVTGLQGREEMDQFDETHERFYPRKEQFLLNVFSWNPRWLEEQFQKETPPPIVDESNLVAMLSEYRTYEEYYKIVEPLLALEMWNGISGDFQSRKNNPNMFSIVPNSIHNTPVSPTKGYVSTLTLEIVVSKCDLQSQSHPVNGELIYFDCLTNTRNEHGFSSRTIFAYITNLRKTVITPLMHFNRNLIYSVKNPHTLLTCTVMTKSLDCTNVQTNIVNSLQRISYLRSKMRIVEALQYLPSSPLMDIILHPNVEDYQLPPANNLESYNLVTKDNLNTKQLEAVIRITNAVVQGIPKICLIQGPPGTGKSRVIVNLVTQILYGDNRYNSEKRLKILVCAPSNAAIDEIVLKLLEVQKSFEKKNRFNIVRVGQTETMHPLAKTVSVRQLARNDVAHTGDTNSSSSSCSHNIDENECEVMERRILAKMYRNAEDMLLKRADVMASTLSSCYTNQMESIFAGNDETISVCIVDEATQSTEPETLIPLMLGVKTLVLVGDTNQLTATILSQKAKQLDLDQSLFTRIWNAFKCETNNPIIQLTTQYRMAAPVALFPNKYFYNGALTNAAIMRKLPLHFYRVINLDSRQDHARFCNSNEANFVAMLVYTIIARTNYDNATLPVKVGIITPYNDQKIMLRKKIKERIKHLKDRHNIVYEVNTVDNFQGQERDVIIMSCVRSSGIGFLSDRRRLCVALTRARHSLILCGHFRTFRRDPMWNALLEDAKTRGVYINVNSKANPEDIRSHIIR